MDKSSYASVMRKLTTSLFKSIKETEDLTNEIEKTKNDRKTYILYKYIKKHNSFNCMPHLTEDYVITFKMRVGYTFEDIKIRVNTDHFLINSQKFGLPSKKMLWKKGEILSYHFVSQMVRYLKRVFGYHRYFANRLRWEYKDIFKVIDFCKYEINNVPFELNAQSETQIALGYCYSDDKYGQFFSRYSLACNPRHAPFGERDVAATDNNLESPNTKFVANIVDDVYYFEGRIYMLGINFKVPRAIREAFDKRIGQVVASYNKKIWPVSKGIFDLNGKQTELFAPSNFNS